MIGVIINGSDLPKLILADDLPKQTAYVPCKSVSEAAELFTSLLFGIPKEKVKRAFKTSRTIVLENGLTLKLVLQ